MSAVSHSRHVCCVQKQTCLACDTADMSAVAHSRPVCCATGQSENEVPTKVLSDDDDDEDEHVLEGRFSDTLYTHIYIFRF